MRHWSRSARLVLVIVSTLAACTGSAGPVVRHSAPPVRLPLGGTLRVRYLLTPPGFDPAAYDFADWELFRCCMARTLLSYNGRSIDEGGADLYPDLATSMPKVSTDGLTWTFHLKPNLHYAPPFQHTEIVARDIIRALQREADPEVPSGYAFYYSVIRGFDGFAQGRASNISGLQARDDHTLVVDLTEPTGDLGYRLSLPASAPIPPGAAHGHETDYGRFLVSSGPYMLEGSGDLDFSRPPEDQPPVSGFAPARFNEVKQFAIGGSATLVRNPSWSQATDALRGAYVDRIEIDVGPPGRVKIGRSYFAIGFPAQFAIGLTAIRRGRLDLIPDSPLPSDSFSSFASPASRDLVHQDLTMGVDYISMNVAAPPFDDIHVRKAFYLAMDRNALQARFKALPEPIYGKVPNHIVPDAMEDGLLVNWRPGWVPVDATHDLSAARAQMRRSNYDRNGDGICDSRACREVVLISDDEWPKLFNGPVRASAASIGIRLAFRRFDSFDTYPEKDRPRYRWPLNANRWLADYPNGSDFLPQFFDGASLDDPQTFNSSVLGATREELHRWGYARKRVPSVDARIDQCDALIGASQAECWARLDKVLMNNIVPWVPFLFEQTAVVVSSRMEHYELDQFVGYPALDQIALKLGSP